MEVFFLSLAKIQILYYIGNQFVIKFYSFYDSSYSKASISRMLDYLREDVSQWLTRSLEAYYPIVFIDCVHMKIHRKRSVETEAFYVVAP